MTTTTINFETIETGRSQFNAKDAKNFRDTLAKWHTADFEIAEEINKTYDYVESRKKCIETNVEFISDEKNAMNFVELSKRKEEIEKFETDIAIASQKLSDYKKEQVNRLDAGLRLVTEDLYNAYETYAKDTENTEKYQAYIVTIAQWLLNNGVVPKMATCIAISGIVGTSGGANSAKGKVKNGTHNKIVTKKSFPKVFIGGMCDLLKDILPTHKFQYIPFSLREKNKNK